MEEGWGGYPIPYKQGLGQALPHGESMWFHYVCLIYLYLGDVITCYCNSFLTYGPLRAFYPPNHDTPQKTDHNTGNYPRTKTRESNHIMHLQMKLQRQHFLLSYLKTLSVGPAGVELTTSRVTARCSTN